MSGTPDTTKPAVTEEDRAKAVGIMTASPPRTDINPYWRIDAIAAALAAERGKADALRAEMLALVDELDADSERAYQRSCGHRDEGSDGQYRAYEDAAARLRAIADGQR